MGVLCLTLEDFLHPSPGGFFYVRKSRQYSKRAGGGEYRSFSLLAFSTRVIGVSR
nr:hypothetical protein [Escherichia coli]